MAHLNSRHNQLLDRQQQLPLTALTAEIEPLTAEAASRRQELENLQTAQAELSQAILAQRQSNAELAQTLNRERQQLQTLQSRHASLEALQQSALGFHNDFTKAWLTKNSLTHSPRLGQFLEVNSGWELAVETVLRGYFDAVCLENMDNLLDSLTQITEGQLTLISREHTSLPSTDRVLLPLLVTQVRCQWPLHEWLSAIYIAENLAEALAVRIQLAPTESIITKDGIWLGKNWARINKAASSRQWYLSSRAKICGN